MTELTRFEEAAKHYRGYRSEILEAGRSEWGVDPFEWECFSRMSPIEADLWAQIRGIDAVIYPQYPIGRFFADFCNPVAGVVIECDGAAWHQNAAKDQKRQQLIEAEGYAVYRITGKQCQDKAYARQFIEQIALRHRLIRGAADFCVGFDAERGVFVAASRDDMKNHNAGRAMDRAPGIALIRDRLDKAAAARIADAFNLKTEARATA